MWLLSTIKLSLPLITSQTTKYEPEQTKTHLLINCIKYIFHDGKMLVKNKRPFSFKNRRRNMEEALGMLSLF